MSVLQIVLNYDKPRLTEIKGCFCLQHWMPPPDVVSESATPFLLDMFILPGPVASLATFSCAMFSVNTFMSSRGCATLKILMKVQVGSGSTVVLVCQN